jgi:hypothetical protein
MRWCSKLVDEEMHVIFAVDITEFAIVVIRIFLLMYDHRTVGFEVLEALLVGTLDLHLDNAKNEAFEYCRRERFEGREKFQITNREDQVDDKWGCKESMNRIDEGSEG